MGAEPIAAAAVLEFEIPCDLAQVRPAGDRVRLFLLQHHRPEAEVIDAQVAAVEACNNAIKYVRADAKHKPVKLCAMLSSTELMLEVVDHSSGFEWPEKASLPSANAESGRGIFLIQAAMPDTKYERGQNENRLIMRRSLQ